MPDSARRVAHVTTAHPHTDNRIFRKECAALAEAGLDVHLIAVADGDALIHGVRLKALPRHKGRVARMVLGPWDAWRALRTVRPAMIHVHDPELIPLAVLWRTLHRRPAVFDAHEDLPKQVRGKHYLPGPVRPVIAGAARQLERLAGSRLDAVVVATPSIAHNFPQAKVTLVQNFPWLRNFPEPTPLTTGDRAVVYIGGISDGRGLPQMLDAVGRSDPASELILAGPASAETVERHLVPARDHVDYRGVIGVEDIPALLASARVGLATLHPLPNYLESQSTKIYEYMAAARPFIASDFPSWMEQLEKFDCGIFVDPLDPQQISDAIQEFLSDDQRAREMGLRGRRALEEHFTFEREGERLVEMTRLLLEADSR